MHVFDTGVARVDFDFVVDRWSSPFWRTWDWMLLSLALLHGVNGTRVIIETLQGAGIGVDEMVVCGGLPFQNRLLMQLSADITGFANQGYLADLSPYLPLEA